MPSSIFVVPFINSNPVIDLSEFTMLDGCGWSCIGQVGNLPTCLVRVTLASDEDLDALDAQPDVLFIEDCEETTEQLTRALNRAAKKRVRKAKQAIRQRLKGKNRDAVEVDDELANNRPFRKGLRRLHRVDKLTYVASGGGEADD